MENFDKLKILLDETYDWPTEYNFKFILPPESKEILLAFFPASKVSKNQKQVNTSA